MVINEIPVKDYLTPSKIGSFCINPYVGCPHACKYCHASFMKRFTNHPEPWGDFSDIKIKDKPINLRKISDYPDRHEMQLHRSISQGIKRRMACHPFNMVVYPSYGYWIWTSETQNINLQILSA